MWGLKRQQKFPQVGQQHQQERSYHQQKHHQNNKNNKKVRIIEESSKTIKKNDKTKTKIRATSKGTSTISRRNPETLERTTAILTATKKHKNKQLRQHQQQHQQQQKQQQQLQQQQQQDEAHSTYEKVITMPTRKKTHSKIIAVKPHDDIKSSNTKNVHEFRENVNFIYNFFFIGYFCFVSFILLYLLCS